MRVAVFSAKEYEQPFIDAANSGGRHEIAYFAVRFDAATAPLAAEHDAISAFVHDVVDAAALEVLARGSTRFVALRSAGFNNVDLTAAERLGITVARVPAYAPNAVAEHTIGLILALDRKIHRAYARVREGNFALDGLLGFDLAGRTVGVLGTGRIGSIVARILLGFGCRVIAHDQVESEEVKALGVEYLPLSGLYREADIITLHLPLLPETHHIIDARALQQMKRGVMLINTSRGALIDTQAVIEALKSGVIGYLGLDVYEEEADLFFENLADTVIQDDVFARLLTFPNVLITAHQAFFTEEALRAIAETTIANLDAFEQGRVTGNEIGPELVVR